MRRNSLQAVVCLLMLLGTAGCAAQDQAPGAVEIHRMTDLEGPLGGTDSTLSPVIQDVYDRSIPEEVYSVH
ncbi:hypothetical protein AMQ84_06365 [Paenibacillus riograndensis]|uniref:Uncharacterized protein n=1 Tax=Paenibacillus riograndensis TaxID=483937 RepID=A0A132U817_9BACL|nr:hypothetical protein [Paenibacillus riograndensis]KWX79536.1 hypothetical protein AMQ84_06365 [Paenibacillus riograndensis]KWX87395.1 hypothetical protein AMQ83_13360 [Paenibacillus riograndensis]